MSDGSKQYRWRLTGVWLLMGIGLATALLIDQAATDFLTRDHVRGWIIRIFTVPAAGAVYLIPLAIIASFPNGRRLCVGFIASLLLSTLLTYVLKWSCGRARPYMDLGSWSFHFFAWIEDFEHFAFSGKYESFPSGHSSAAAALATLLGIYFPSVRWVFYFFAALVGLERIINDRHFLSDVLGGFVVGGLSVRLCVRLLGWKYYAREWSASAIGRGLPAE